MLISVATFILVTLSRAIVLRGYLLLAIVAGLFVNVCFLLIALLNDPDLAYVVARLRFAGLALATLIWLFSDKIEGHSRRTLGCEKHLGQIERLYGR